jgi:nucleotide-binding universal stress UspA family protein
MNARGSTEVIVATVGLSIGVLTQDLFTMIVTMAVVTTLAMPAMLRWALARLPLEEEERLRLAREALEAKGFVSNVERLLVAVDDSANGRLAVRLAGLLAGSRGIATTVLDLGRGSAEAAVKAAAAADPAGKGGEAPRKVHVTLRTEALPAASAVTREAQKGYGLLLVGIGNSLAARGGFHEQISRIAAFYDGPLAVVLARGAHAQAPELGPLNILVPVRGNKVSRHAAEVAFAMARPTDPAVTALYVLSTAGLGAAQRRLQQPRSARSHGEAVLKEIVELASRYGQSIRTALRLNAAAEDAILRQTRLGAYNLVVMGVGRPAGETLFFGKVAAAVLEAAERSVLLIAS